MAARERQRREDGSDSVQRSARAGGAQGPGGAAGHLLALQRRAGNQAVVGLVGRSDPIGRVDDARRTSVISAHDAPSARQGVVQRKLHFEGMKNTESEDRLAKVLEIVSEHPVWKRLQQHPKIHLYLVIDDELGPNPAEVSNARFIDGEWGFALYLRRWFVRTQPPGYVVGAINHELGVHVLPRLDKIDRNLEAAAKGEEAPYSKEALSSKEKGGIDDHRLVMARGTTEFEGYFKLALGSAQLLLDRGREQDALDVMTSYLLDVAAMAANGDKAVIVAKASLPNPWRTETYEYVRGRYAALRAELPLAWQERVPELSVAGIQAMFGRLRGDYLRDLPRGLVVSARENPLKAGALGALILALLLWWILWRSGG